MNRKIASKPIGWMSVVLLAALFCVPAVGRSAELLGVEAIEETLPFFDGSVVRDPREGDEFPPLRVLLSRSRYWAQDGHLDVVAQLDDDDPRGELRVRLLGEGGQELSRVSISPLPGPRFIFYPAIPDALANGGHGEVEIAWVRDGQTVAEHRQAFRVEVYEEPAPRSGRVRLTVPNDPGVRQEGVPATVGVPFPRGVLGDAANLRLVDEAGSEVPLQVMETARWSKFGSVKWVLCDFTVDLDGQPPEVFLEYGPDVSRAERSAISVEDSDGFPVVDAGRLRFDRGLWFDAAADGNFVQVLDEQGLSGAFVEHEDGRFYRAPIADRYEVEESGPEKVVLKREGWYQEEDGDRAFCQYIIRYVIHRDSPLVRVFHTWLFTGDGNRDRIRNMGWEFALPEGFERRGFLTAFGGEGEWADADYLVQWDYDHFDLVSGGQADERAEARAPGVAAARGNGVNLYFGAKDFWQNFPSELEFRDGSLWFHNWPRHNRPAGYTFDGELVTERGDPAIATAERHRHYDPDRLTRSEWKLNAVQLRFAHEGEALDFRIPRAITEDPIYTRAIRGEDHWDRHEPESVNAQGISRTEEMWLLFGSEEWAGSDPERTLEALNEETLRAFADPEWVARSGAFYEMHHRDTEKYPEEERIYEVIAKSPGLIAERLGAYGMWIYGDIPAWVPDPGGRQPDLYRAYRKRHHGWPFSWVPFARSGDSAMFRAADAATRQMIDVAYCHYVSGDVEVSVGPGRFRKIGRWHRNLLPWAGRTGPTTRCYESQTDFLWHAWYLTGYRRALENALSWGEQTKIQEEMRHRHHIPAQIPGGNRAPITLLKSYLETYEATFEPWFLVAAHAIGENHLTAHRQERYYGRLWETADREFHRFTGCEQYRAFYLAYARNAVDMDVNRPGTGRYLFRTPHLPPKAYAWRLSGDDYYLRRAVGGIDFATSEFHDGAGLADYMHVYARRAGTAYSLFTPSYLKFFPAGLWALEEAGHRPDPIPNHFPIHLTALDAHRPTLLVRKQEAGEPVTVKLRSWRGAMRIGARDPDREVGYEIVGPDGEAVASGMWRIGSTEEVEIPAGAAAGDYRLQFATSVGLVVPTTPVDTPELIEVPPGGSLGGTEGVFWFHVPEGTERFAVDALSRIAVWDPDGRRVWDQSDYPSDDERAERAVIDVHPEHTGRLWRITSGTFRMDPDIAHRFSVCPARWFEAEGGGE